MLQQIALVPHETGGLRIVVNPPPYLDKKIQLHYQHDGNRYDDQPQQQFAQNFHFCFFLLERDGELNRGAQLGKYGCGIRPHTAPDKK